MTMRRFTALCLSLAAGLAAAADWPQYRGPNGDGTSPETGILTTWPADGPKKVWKIAVGEGFGSFAVAKGKAYLFMERAKQEYCVAYDAATGKELWATAIDKTIFEGSGGNGPRSTPTVDGDKVYVYGTYFKLACLSAADGKVVWQHDLGSEFSGQNGTGGIKEWGNGQSPLVEGPIVVVAGGGDGQTFLAFDKLTGAVKWKKGSEKVTHASPTITTVDGVRQVVFFVQSGMVALDGGGNELWRFKFPFSTSTAASPIIANGIAYCSAGYGVGGGAAKLTKSGGGFKAAELWRTPNQNINHWTTSVQAGGYIYGLFGFKQFGSEPLKCVELATGKELWSQNGFGQGGLILVDGHLLIQGDQGQLVLVKADPKAYSEVARAQVLGGKCWTMPVISDAFVYCRNPKEAVCLDLHGK